MVGRTSGARRFGSPGLGGQDGDRRVGHPGGPRRAVGAQRHSGACQRDGLRFYAPVDRHLVDDDEHLQRHDQITGDSLGRDGDFSVRDAPGDELTDVGAGRQGLADLVQVSVRFDDREMTERLHGVGEKEVELQDLSRALKTARDQFSVEGVFSGALASVYQKSRVERVCSELGLQSFAPLWQIEPKTHLLNLIREGFDTIITGVAALGLDESWLGRRLDVSMVEELLELQRKHGMHAALEGGEGETFVLDCPIFKERVEILSSRKHWNGMAGRLEILEARLVPKRR